MYINIYRNREEYILRCYPSKAEAVSSAVEMKQQYKYELETAFEVENINDLLSNETDSIDISYEVKDCEKEMAENIDNNKFTWGM